jgi:hypothetical protein
MPEIFHISLVPKLLLGNATFYPSSCLDSPIIPSLSLRTSLSLTNDRRFSVPHLLFESRSFRPNGVPKQELGNEKNGAGRAHRCLGLP